MDKVRTHLNIIEEICVGLEKHGLVYEFKALKNEIGHHCLPTEFIAETCSLLLKMNEKELVRNSVGVLVEEYDSYAKRHGIFCRPSESYSLEQKEFVINGNNFSTLKGFYLEIGNLLTEKNDWGKNWNALNDILIGGFGKTQYGEPFKLVWKNSKKSESELEEFEEIILLISEHNNIDLIKE